MGIRLFRTCDNSIGLPPITNVDCDRPSYFLSNFESRKAYVLESSIAAIKSPSSLATGLLLSRLKAPPPVSHYTRRKSINYQLKVGTPLPLRPRSHSPPRALHYFLFRRVCRISLQSKVVPFDLREFREMTSVVEPPDHLPRIHNHPGVAVCY